MAAFPESRIWRAETVDIDPERRTRPRLANDPSDAARCIFLIPKEPSAATGHWGSTSSWPLPLADVVDRIRASLGHSPGPGRPDVREVRDFLGRGPAYARRFMNWQWVVWIYVGFLVAGGLVGFLKAGSTVSLITAVVSAAILVLVIQGILPFLVALVELAVLIAVFGLRFSKSKKFMPSGMLAAVSAVALIALLALRPR